MRCTVSSERKVQASKPYESFGVFVSMETDTALEPIEVTFKRVHEIVDAEVRARKLQLAEEYQKELEAKQVVQNTA